MGKLEEVARERGRTLLIGLLCFSIVELWTGFWRWERIMVFVEESRCWVRRLESGGGDVFEILEYEGKRHLYPWREKDVNEC